MALELVSNEVKSLDVDAKGARGAGTVWAQR